MGPYRNNYDIFELHRMPMNDLRDLASFYEIDHKWESRQTIAYRILDAQYQRSVLSTNNSSLNTIKKMIQKKTDIHWTDHKGQKVPREYIDKFDLRKEAVIGKLTTEAIAMSKKLAQFKQKAFSEADELYSEMLRNADIAPGERKGNYTIWNFDKSIKLTVDVSDRIEFDENITFAQEKINQFLLEKTNGADQDLAVLVNNAFTTTKGRLDTKRIFQLFQLKITHPTWQQAMDLIRKSIQTNSSVRYLTFFQRGAGDTYNVINLNFSNL